MKAVNPNFLSIFESLCLEKKVSGTKAVVESGLGKSSYSNWQKNGALPAVSSLNKLADYFNVPVETFLVRGTAQEDVSSAAASVNSNSFIDLFHILCVRKGVTPSRAVADCGFSRSVYTGWTKNNVIPRNSTLGILADYFGVTVRQLKGLDPLDDANGTNSTNTNANKTSYSDSFRPAPTYSNSSNSSNTSSNTINSINTISSLDEYEKTLISLFREASVESRLEMIRQFMTVLDDDKAIARSAQMTLPHVGLKASAGIGESLLDDDDTQDWTVEVNTETRKADFCVTIHGDSMKPTYRDGDVALVRQQPSVEVGEVGIFALNGEGYIKKLGRGELVSLNTLYKNIPFGEDDEIRCFGKVVGILDEDWIAER